MTVEKKSVQELEEAIAELKSRWPKHSVKPQMWMELETLEEQLEEAKSKANENETNIS